MPSGQAGTWSHGRTAYVHKYCRCKEICTPAHTKARREERAEGRQAMNGGTSLILQLVDDVVTVTQRQSDILDVWLRDGADAETVARRMGLSRVTIHRNLAAVQAACEFESRLELAVAILRGFVTYRVESRANDETSPARRRKGA